MFWACYGEYRGRRELAPFLRYVRARCEADEEEYAFRSYLTETLRLQQQGKRFGRSWTEIVDRRPRPERSGDEIALEVIRGAGLCVEARK